ncbi:Uncharacterised protein [Streptococcus pneumoniae]|nr:Uncharacterised protein [Streptococcus pneumoniae]
MGGGGRGAVVVGGRGGERAVVQAGDHAQVPGAHVRVRVEGDPDRAGQRIALGVGVADDLVAQLAGEGGPPRAGALEVGGGEVDHVAVGRDRVALRQGERLVVHRLPQGRGDLHRLDRPRTAGREGRAHDPLEAAFEVVQKSHDGAPFHSCPSRYYGPGWETAENSGILPGGTRVGEVPEGASRGGGGDAGAGVGADLRARASGG